MTFCKEFNARTSHVRPDVPVQVTLVPLTDRIYKFWLRTPQVQWFLKRCARLPKGSDFGANMPPVGNVELKEVYHIAKAKCMDPPLIGVPLRAMCIRIIGTARAMGITVTRQRLPEFSKRDDTPVEILEQLRKEIRV